MSEHSRLGAIDNPIGRAATSKAAAIITAAVDEGGSKLDALAQGADTTPGEFRDAFRSDPVQAINVFIRRGCLRPVATFDCVGLSEIRVRDTLLRLADSRVSDIERLQFLDAWARPEGQHDE